MNEKRIPDFIRFNFCNIKKIYYKYNSFFQDAKSILYLLKNKRYKKELIGAVIIPTTFCNANCSFCANRYLLDKRKTMSDKIFRKTVKELKGLGITTIDLTPTIGEVFLDKGFIRKINYLKKNNLRFNFYTNGFLIEKNINKILNLGMKEFIIDIADIDSKYESRVFQVSEELCKRKINSIFELIKENKTMEIQLSFRPMRKFNEIIRDMRKTPFWNLYKKKRFKMDYLTAYDNWGGSILEKDLLGFQTIRKSPLIKKIPCRNLSILSIMPDGDIRLCGCRALYTFKDELVIGNIKKDSIKSCINSEKYNKLICNFKNNKVPKVCEKCTFYKPKN